MVGLELRFMVRIRIIDICLQVMPQVSRSWVKCRCTDLRMLRVVVRGCYLWM